MDWSQQYKELGDAIFKAKTDASNMNLQYDDEMLAKHYFKQASKHLASAKSKPHK